ncbi:RNA polymerase sigma factor [Pedobacter paludis]|uniref:RNA polymerase subunit sigma n=1 Tax=Pedobacter paludis TaxID=2203212 RepID=A0A317EWS0_9SPHI|nr:RNA polymerase sigma factor [Pedobacter paludis]PWS29678.1 RNA polymerase subunit sigma [Pedobacter paludis]
MNQKEFSLAADLHASSLHSHAKQFTRDEDEAKDLVQDTLLKGIRFCHNFESGTNVKGWLYVIMRNTFLNDYRKKQKRDLLVNTEEDISSAQLLPSASKNGSENSFIMGDIQKALSSLDDDCRIPFQRYFEGYKYQEIADELSIPLGTVKTRIHQARLELKKFLRTYKDRGGMH